VRRLPSRRLAPQCQEGVSPFGASPRIGAAGRDSATAGDRPAGSAGGPRLHHRLGMVGSSRLQALPEAPIGPPRRHQV
jgi:hypothetical protein